jgi:chromosome partitioning protein
MKYSAVINQAPSLPSQLKRIEEAKAICHTWGIPCLESVLAYRNVYDDSEESGSSVFEAKSDEKATLELISIIKEFLNIDINYE